MDEEDEQSPEDVNQIDIELAEQLLRVLNGGHEPYAPTVYPAAEILAKCRTRHAIASFEGVRRIEARALFEAFFQAITGERDV